MEVCLSIERAERFAKNGTLTEQTAKKIIGKILERTTGEPLHNFKTGEWLEQWLAAKEQVRTGKTGERYRQVIRDFTASLGSRANLARVGVGVVVKDGTPKPDIGSVAAFKQALFAAKSVAYIDPAAGGSSGIYVAGLLDKLGIAADVKRKAKLIPGGAVAEHVAKGEAELGIHQISEILPVKGVTLVGPLPDTIQNYTVYAAGIGAQAKEPDAAKALLKVLSGPAAADVLKSKGMDPP